MNTAITAAVEIAKLAIELAEALMDAVDTPKDFVTDTLFKINFKSVAAYKEYLDRAHSQ